MKGFIQGDQSNILDRLLAGLSVPTHAGSRPDGSTGALRVGAPFSRNRFSLPTEVVSDLDSGALD